VTTDVGSTEAAQRDHCPDCGGRRFLGLASRRMIHVTSGREPCGSEKPARVVSTLRSVPSAAGRSAARGR